MHARLLSFLTLFALPTAALLGQSVRWDPPGGTLPVGQASPLQLVFQDCEPKDAPKIPPVDGLELQYSDQSTNMSWVNGTYSHSVTYTYTAILSKNQSIQIPTFQVETSKGAIAVPAAQYGPTGATVGGNGQSLESAASSRLTAKPDSVWAGQVFDLSYRIEASQSYYPNFDQRPLSWKADPLLAEDWSQPVVFQANSGGEPKTGVAYRTRAVIRKPGTVPVNPVSQLVNLSIGMTGFGFFQQRQYQQFSVTSSTPTIEVRELPAPPAGFSGAVGHFTLTSKVVPAGAQVGEPITWTLVLKGTGNWPDIAGLPAREVSRDFQVVQPKPKRTNDPGKIFDATLSEDVVLIPTKAGDYRLNPVSFLYFDPDDGDYKTLTTPEATVTITALPAAPEAGAQPAAGNGEGLALKAPPAAPSLPNGLPHDPLPDSGPGPEPWTELPLIGALATPFVLLAAFWLGLAFRRARQTDPNRPRREARARLAATLAQFPDTNPLPPPASDLLKSWQRDTAILFAVGHAAPSPSHLPPSAASLWQESERALYGPERVLPPRWKSRAEAALAETPALRFEARRMFRPRNLLPWLMAAAFGGLLAGAAVARAVEPEAAYRRGDFAAAESAWKAAVAAHPADWSARYNLSLALAEQNRWDQAAAQAAAAFVQQPNDAAVRWQFALACDKAGFSPTALAPFLAPGPRQSLARLLSPAAWQIVLIACAWLVAAALGWMVARAFRARRREVGGGRWEGKLAMAVLILGLLGAGAAWLGWSSFGPAASEQAIVTWRDATLCSIPTEADTSQKTEPLAPGSVALADRTFLGWTRLSFENGETGWVRTEETVPLWR